MNLPEENITVQIKVHMECGCLGCEKRVKKSVKGMEGVTHVQMDRVKGKLTVSGRIHPDNVLERVRRRTSKKVEFWTGPQDYIYDVVPHPYAYAPQPYYHNNTPPEYVLQGSEASRVARARFFDEVNYTTPFNDDNPNACMIM